jgi:hypothetical protein
MTFSSFSLFSFIQSFCFYVYFLLSFLFSFVSTLFLFLSSFLISLFLHFLPSFFIFPSSLLSVGLSFSLSFVLSLPPPPLLRFELPCVEANALLPTRNQRRNLKPHSLCPRWLVSWTDGQKIAANYVWVTMLRTTARNGYRRSSPQTFSFRFQFAETRNISLK